MNGSCSLSDDRPYKRVTLVAEKGRIIRVFFPVFPPDRNADDVIEYLRLGV